MAHEWDAGHYLRFADARTLPAVDLLSRIELAAPQLVIDLGCGPGNSTALLKQRWPNAAVTGLDSSANLLDAARRDHPGIDFAEGDIAAWAPSEPSDVVFANASLFHVPRQELPQVLRQLHATLKPRGVLFSSNPRGDNEEGWNGERYGAYHDLQAWRSFMQEAGFAELTHYYRPTGLPRDQQPWLASVWRRD